MMMIFVRDLCEATGVLEAGTKLYLFVVLEITPACLDGDTNGLLRHRRLQCRLTVGRDMGV